MSETSGDTKACHSPEKGMKRARLRRKEIPSRVMGSSGLGDLIVRSRLDRVDQIREPDSILDEKDWNIVSHDILE